MLHPFNKIKEQEARFAIIAPKALLKLGVKVAFFAVCLVALFLSKGVWAQENPTISISQSTISFKPGVRHSMAFEVINTGNSELEAVPSFSLPTGWNLITAGGQINLKAGERQIVLAGFFIPFSEIPGQKEGQFSLKNSTNGSETSVRVVFNVEELHNIQVRNLTAPLNIQAGETIEAVFEIRNEGNVTERLNVKSANQLKDDESYTIAPDSTILVRVQEKSSAQANGIQLISCELEVTNEATGKSKKSYSTTRVFPTKIARRDAYFRFPVEASVYHNIYSNSEVYQSSQFYELRGTGHLDLKKEHYLNFIVRAPNQSNLTRFGVNDQYSLMYRYKDRTKVFVGDHVFNINRLGFMGRFGFGAKVDQRIGKWELSAFFTKPRLYTISKEPIFGGKLAYNPSNNLKLALSFTSSKEIAQYYNYTAVKSAGESGQIVVFATEYEDPKTNVQMEVATSVSANSMDYAGDINVSHAEGRFSYRGNLTMAGENFFGSLSNSLRYSNGLSYNLRKWNFSVGQGYSKVHERRDTTIYGVLPYFENYYASVGHRINQSHFINLRADYRSRKDKGDRSVFDYEERGIDYRYKYSKNRWVVNFNGRLTRTRNLLSESRDLRNTSGEFLNINYRVSTGLTIRGNFNHNRTNRYNVTNVLTDYYLYGGGLNAKVSRKFRIGASYNSGFSPEEAYKKRDFVNANALLRIGKHHQLEARANYYMNPNTINTKEVFAFLKYTYRFGAPLKKVLKQGGIRGLIISKDPTIKLKGVQVIASGSSVKSDTQGRFELNNLPIGNGYILVDESTLPGEVVLVSKLPYEVQIEEGRSTEMVLELARAASLVGKLTVEDDTEERNLSAYLKLQNDTHTYHIESDKTGAFAFKRIVPGSYKLSVVRMKKGKELEPVIQEIAIDTNENNNPLIFRMKTLERKITIKKSNFKIYN